MVRPLPAIAGALLLVLGVATGAFAAPPKEANFKLDGVSYSYIMGVNGTGHAVLGEGGDASTALPIDSCGFVQLHPGTPNGRVLVMGLQDYVPLEFFIDQFRKDDGKRGFSYDVGVAEDGVPRTADLAVRGNGTLRIDGARYYDPVSSSGVELIDKDQAAMVATAELIPAGVRDDATGAVATGDNAGDTELHIHLRGAKDAQARNVVTTYQTAGDLPSTPTQDYGEVHRFQNLKYGGHGVLTVTTTAYLPAGSNTYEFVVVAPDGEPLANLTLRPALLADDAGTVDFPLDQFGTYTLLVRGDVSLSRYTATLTQEPPADFDLHFWWENVTFGRQAYEDFVACAHTMNSPNSIVAVASIVGQPPPPTFRIAMVILGVVGAVALVSIAIKMASDEISLSAFRKAK